MTPVEIKNYFQISLDKKMSLSENGYVAYYLYVVYVVYYLKTVILLCSYTLYVKKKT